METTKGIRIEKTGWSRAATGFRVSQECVCCSGRLVIRPGLGMSFEFNKSVICHFQHRDRSIWRTHETPA